MNSHGTPWLKTKLLYLHTTSTEVAIHVRLTEQHESIQHLFDTSERALYSHVE